MPPRALRSRFLAAAVAAVALVTSAPAAAVLAQPTASSVGPAPAAVVSAAAATATVTASTARALAYDDTPDPGPRHAPSVVQPTTPAPPKAKAAAPKAAPAPKPAPKPTTRLAKPAPAGVRKTTTLSYHGTNHMWMPALGINRSVTYFPCSRSTPPGLAVYRWGCAGANNVYLFAHAYAAFKPLHDAYVGGRLRKGMKVMYADGSGHVRTYAISWWKLTTPDKGGFAFAAQSRPSLTLQTCVGSKSQYRLIVRLVQVG